MSDIYKVRLESIAAGGDAVGRISGKPVFVEGGAPCETVLCRITEDRGKWARAELLEITEPSPFRVESVCAHYGICGGCNLQHIDYKAQLAAKVSILKDLFLRLGGFAPPEPKVFSSHPFEYRNRMQFHCLRQGGGEPSAGAKFGLKGRGNKIIAVKDCPIAVHEIRQVLQNGGNDFPLPLEKDRFTVFAKNGLMLSEGASSRQTGKILILEKEILMDASLFFQSNIFMLEKLIVELKKIAEEANRNLPMADLYCGVGTFAIFLSDFFPGAVLAEENKKSVALARENLKTSKIFSATEFFALRDTDWEKAIFRKGRDFGFTVADPPRAGLSLNLARLLAKDGSSILAYVSCDAASLARDAKILKSGGYVLKELSFFDFYPQTAHIESLAVFVK